MGVKPETRYLDAIREGLEARGAKLIKLHGSIFMKKGNPDIIGTLNGITFVIETKFKDGILSDKQYYELSEWEKRGAVVIKASSGVDTPEAIVSITAVKVWLARRKIMREENEVTNRSLAASAGSVEVPAFTV